jgi:hypothetical protein
MGNKILITKLRLNYRLAVDGEAGCEECRKAGWYSMFQRGECVGVARRCEPIGTGESRKYQIRADHRCDGFGARGD